MDFTNRAHSGVVVFSRLKTKAGPRRWIAGGFGIGHWSAYSYDSYLDVALEVRINGLFHLLAHGVYWGEITHFLTIDPKFQRDIQVIPFIFGECEEEEAANQNPKN